MADRVVASPAGFHGGPFKSKPRIVVIHSVESEATPGLAYSLATGWLQHEKVSIHGIAGPDECVRMVPIDTIAYHCGGGNSVSLGMEHTGRASWTFDQWISGDSHQGHAPGAFDALRNGARVVAEWCKALGIPRVWLTPDEARAGKSGLATHNTMRLAFGGTTHTDPGAGFPYAIYLKMVQQFAGDNLAPAPAPAPNTGPQTGGAETDTNDMADITPDQMDQIAKRTVALLFSAQPEAVFPVDGGNITLQQAISDLLKARFAADAVWKANLGAGYAAGDLLNAAAGNPGQQPGK